MSCQLRRSRNALGSKEAVVIKVSGTGLYITDIYCENFSDFIREKSQCAPEMIEPG